ncbi:hypothetical protein [Streptomyces sp. NPDC054887]
MAGQSAAHARRHQGGRRRIPARRRGGHAAAEAIDAGTCVLEAGADSPASLAPHLGLPGHDFTVAGPPELRAHLREPAGRYASSTPPPPESPSGGFTAPSDR